MLCVALLAVMASASATAADECRYPGELPGYEFCEAAAWRTLRPLVSTAADVRRVLGPAVGESDLAHHGEPYPGDEAAIAPVLTFDGGTDWAIFVYFVKSDAEARGRFPAALRDRLLSIDLVPKRRRPFAGVRFGEGFRKEHVVAADAAWDEYADGSGLVYAVYTSRPAHGDEQPGDLERIRYGPSDALEAELAWR